MAGHLHEQCVMPWLAFRWRHRWWICDCGKPYRRTRQAWPLDKWTWTQAPGGDHYAKRDHDHHFLASAYRVNDLENRLTALEAKKKRVPKGA